MEKLNNFKVGILMLFCVLVNEITAQSSSGGPKKPTQNQNQQNNSGEAKGNLEFGLTPYFKKGREVCPLSGWKV